MQVGGGRGGSAALVRAAQGGDLAALTRELVRTEGLGALWRGNLPQVLRVAPNAAVQLGVYELLKRRLATAEAPGEGREGDRVVEGGGRDVQVPNALPSAPRSSSQSASEGPRSESGASQTASSPSRTASAFPPAAVATTPTTAAPVRLRLSTPRRLLAGAIAGSVALSLTYPLDTLRLRCAVDAACRTPQSALRAVLAEQGVWGLYRGLPAAVLGSAPYVAFELAAYDLLPESLPPALRGLLSAAGATGLCYPLDTLRRRVQMAGAGATMAGALGDALREGGMPALYRGIVPSSLKNLPAKTVKLGVFGTAKKIYATAKREQAARNSEETEESERERM